MNKTLAGSLSHGLIPKGTSHFLGKTDGRPDSHGRGRFNGGWTGSLETAGVASRLLHRDRMTKDALFRMVAPV